MSSRGHFPGPAGHAGYDTSQDAPGVLGHWAHRWLIPQPSFPSAFLVGGFQATLPQACNIAWWCCDLLYVVGPGT